jgi:hypothetical protein
MKAWLAAICAACVLHLPAAIAADNPAARYEILSGPDCAGAGNIIAEAAPAPPNATHVRVQYMGDPGTEELRDEIANVATWDVGMFSGLYASPAAQRGYRDMLPAGRGSAFQLACDSAGFFINTFTFSHAVPVFGAGPSASIGRFLDPAPRAFSDPLSILMLEARIAVPWMSTPTPPTGDGTAQVGFFYYAQDSTSGKAFAHVIGLYDNRTAEASGAYEVVSYDGEVAFVGSPLLETRPDGRPTEFLRVSPHSAPMRFVQPWSEPAFFRAEISYETFRKLLLRFKASSLPAISTEPMDYRIGLFGVIGETMPGTGSDHNVSLGASVTGLQLLRSTRPRFRH